ncbi:fused MFS/spermidine synthase [bacterium]
MKKETWLNEYFTPEKKHSHKIKKIIVKKKTKFQNAAIVDTYTFDRCLVLDGELQSSKSDEFIYHESLVHPAMLLHPNPKTIAILGGGEGATLKEVLKHKSVINVKMIDIDGEVVDFCKKHLKDWHANSFNDKRSKIIIDDAKVFLENTNEKFDVIISDLSCPIENTPAWQLYTKEFYSMLKTKLSKNGLFVLQAASCASPQIKMHSMIFNTLSKVFKKVFSFNAFVSSFDVPWAFIIATQTEKQNPLKMQPKQIDALITKRIKGKLRFYDGISHLHSFNLPKYIREILKKERNVLSKKNPRFFYK